MLILDSGPTRFALLLFALSSPIWLAGAFTSVQLLPGLPATTPLLVLCPAVTAATLVYREGSAPAVKALLARSFDHATIPSKIWLAPSVLLMPCVMIASYVVMRGLRMPLPAPQFSLTAALVLAAVFFIAALAEELGWSGYLIDRLQTRWSALASSICLGALWSTWHIGPLVQAHRSPTWIAWWCLFTIAGRVLIVWIYNNTGHSVFATVLYHASSNFSVYLFPAYGSHFDPRITGPIVAVVAAIAWRRP